MDVWIQAHKLHLGIRANGLAYGAVLNQGSESQASFLRWLQMEWSA